MGPWEVNRVHWEVPAAQAGICIALNWVGASRLSSSVAWGPGITSVLKVYMIKCGCRLYLVAGAGSPHCTRRVPGPPWTASALEVNMIKRPGERLRGYDGSLVDHGRGDPQGPGGIHRGALPKAPREPCGLPSAT